MARPGSKRNRPVERLTCSEMQSIPTVPFEEHANDSDGITTCDVVRVPHLCPNSPNSGQAEGTARGPGEEAARSLESRRHGLRRGSHPPGRRHLRATALLARE